MRLAARGLRDMDTGPLPVADLAELARIRQQARRIRLKGAAAAASAAVLFACAP